jgi:hypothetical protein
VSHFVVNLNEPEKGKTPEIPLPGERRPTGGGGPRPKKRGGCRRLLFFSGIAIVALLLVIAVGGYLYWQGLKDEPQYSLALLVDATRRGDQKTIDELVDTDAVVDSFIPQITDKAVELYGKNLPPQAISKVSQATAPLIPAIKKRARAEVPRVIQEKTDKFVQVPYWAIALGAGRFFDIKTQAQTATVVSKIEGRQFELSMRRNGDKWRVVAIRDEALAQRIAQTVGQELIAISTRDGLKKAGEKLGVPDLENIRKKLDNIFKQ